MERAGRKEKYGKRREKRPFYSFGEREAEICPGDTRFRGKYFEEIPPMLLKKRGGRGSGRKKQGHSVFKEPCGG